MRSLNLDQLRAFAAVAATGGFTAAARALNLTQPAVSQQIKELETRFGVALFERVGKRAIATAAGEDLLAQSRRIFERESRIEDAMRRHREGWLGRVRLGTAATLCAFLLPPTLLAIRQRHPDLELRITEAPSAVVMRAVAEHTLDIGFVTATGEPIDDEDDAVLRRERAFADRLVALWPSTLGPAPRRVTPDSLAGKPFLSLMPGNITHALVQAWLARADKPPATTNEIGSGTSLIALVGAGIGAAIMPPETTLETRRFKGVAVRPIDPPVARAVDVVTRRDKPDSRALSIVRAALLATGRKR